ncbi:MAG: HlyD family efflux transporter periplasmic adaptor subunit [Planctomycetes bacterium]|nr:HlyD family efflux transporter periplasmic adaptor subunit [Planctomycetota bacterium]
MIKHKNRTQNELVNRQRRMRGFIIKSKRMWVILIVAAIALTGVVLLGSIKKAGSASSGTNMSSFIVRQDDLTISVAESGSIKARTSIDINCKVEGQSTIISIVPEGIFITEEDVKNGKVLVELDSSNLEEQIATREIDFASSEAALTEATEAYDIQVKQNESDLAAADLAVKFALLDFKKYLGESAAEKVIDAVGDDPNANFDMVALLDDDDPNDPDSLGGAASQQLNNYQDAIIIATGRLERFIDVNEGTQKLYDANYASELELTGAKLDVASSTIQKKSAEEDLILYKLYDFQKESEKFLSDYYEANRQLVRTGAQNRSKLAQAKAKLRGAESTWRLRRDRLEKLKEQISACVIKAPAPGLVVYGSSGDFMRGRTRVIEEGGTVYQRQKIIELPNLTQMIAEIDVHESAVDKVRPGQRAKIVVDAFPDQSFTGEVLKVAPLPDPQRGFLSPDMKVYKTQVTIEGFHDYLKPGMSTKVDILVEQLEDVLIVPIQVVARRDGKKVCYCLTSSGSEPREVQTGAFNDTFVQITEGLEVGDEVLLNPPLVTETGTSGNLYDKKKPEEGQAGEKGPSQGQGERQPRGGGARPEGAQDGGGRPQSSRRSRQQGGGQTPGSGGAQGERSSRQRGGGQTPGGGGAQGERSSRQQADGQAPGGQFQLTDEMADKILKGMKQFDPENAKKLEELKKSDPEKFKEELKKTMQSMRNRMGQGGGGMRQGKRQGQGQGNGERR